MKTFRNETDLPFGSGPVWLNSEGHKLVQIQTFRNYENIKTTILTVNYLIKFNLIQIVQS